MQFRFADHVLDVARRELRRGGEAVDLEPQVFDLLVHLIRNRDRVVSKDDLLAAVWGGPDRLRIDHDQPDQCRAQGGRRQRRGPAADPHRARKGFRFVGET